MTETAGPKPLVALAAVLGTTVARRLLASGWRLATGKEPPDDPKHPSVAWREAVTWAALSGAVVGVARLGAQKKVAQTFARTDGSGGTDGSDGRSDR